MQEFDQKLKGKKGSSALAKKKRKAWKLPISRFQALDKASDFWNFETNRQQALSHDGHVL